MNIDNYESVPDVELIGLIANDNADAFHELYKRYSTLLYLHARRMLLNENDAKDVIQELFLKIWNSRSVFQTNVSLKAYLYQTVRNQILNIYSRQKIENRYLSSLDEFINIETVSADENVIVNEPISIIDDEIEALPTKMKEVFKMSRKQFLSHKKIAAKLDLSEKMVKKQVANALKILKVKLGKNAFLPGILYLGIN